MSKPFKPRVIVRPWIPRKKIPFISQDIIEQTMKTNFTKLRPVLYVGWCMRKINGKRVLLYLMATGETSKEARTHFKKSEAYGENIWDLSGTISDTDTDSSHKKQIE